MNSAMQLNLSKSVNEPNRSFANLLLAFSLLGLIYAHHMNQVNERYHANIVHLIHVRQTNDDFWYTPPRSPAFNDLIGS